MQWCVEFFTLGTHNLVSLLRQLADQLGKCLGILAGIRMSAAGIHEHLGRVISAAVGDHGAFEDLRERLDKSMASPNRFRAIDVDLSVPNNRREVVRLGNKFLEVGIVRSNDLLAEDEFDGFVLRKHPLEKH